MKKFFPSSALKPIVALVFCIFFIDLATATNYVTIADGNWGTGGVFSPYGPPTNNAGENHTLLISHNVTIDAPYLYTNANLTITIANGASLTINGTGAAAFQLTGASTILVMDGGSIIGAGGDPSDIKLKIGSMSAGQFSSTDLAAITAQNNNVTLTQNGALPAELTKFEAKPRLSSTEINWITASECNVSHFEIERSTDSKIFEKIGEKRASVGCSAIERDYFFTDENPASGVNFYRLRVVDTDGAEAFSAIKTVVSSIKKQEVLVVPNKTEDAFSIENTGREDARFFIRNINGQLIESGEIAAGSSLEMHATDWQSGIYTILFEKGGLFEMTRMVKI